MARRIDTYLQPMLDDDRFAFYEAVRDFSDAEVGAKALAWEREHILLPDSCIKAMADLGLFGLTVDEKYGGQGGGQTELLLMGLAIGYHSQSAAITPGAASSLGTKPLQLNGNDEQKAAHLPDLAAGTRMFVFGLSEPGRGSDATNPEVTAVKDAGNGGWKIRGEKCWSTNARWASHVIVHAMTDANGRPGHRSTCFIVPMNDPTVHYQEMAGKDVWLQSSTGSISFDNTPVPDSAILGEVNEGFKVMANTLNGGRLFIASLALGSLAFALDRTRQYAQERIQFDDKPIGRFQRVQDVVLDMDIALHQGVTWLMQLVREYDAGTMARESAAKVKIECSRRASELVMLAMEVCGGVACLDEFGLMRHHKDLFVTRVGEGSNFALKGLSARPLMPDIASLMQ
ncbi:MAG: acyl-CoA dehydrogenase family protein [Planctomycetota bacterium]